MIPLLLAVALLLPGSTWGPEYEVWRNGALDHTARSVWFNTRGDWEREVWRACRDKGMTPEGALVAVAHARLAGGHWLEPHKTHGPLKGWNLWGIRATKKWKQAGKAYYWHGKMDWRCYGSLEHGVGGWLFVMEDYPQARAELFDEHPSTLTYAAGLFNGNGGRKYKSCKGGNLGLCGDLLGEQFQAIVDKAREDLEEQGFKF